MSDREELVALRRLAELEAKAGATAPPSPVAAQEAPKRPLVGPGSVGEDMVTQWGLGLPRAAQGVLNMGSSLTPGLPGLWSAAHKAGLVKSGPPMAGDIAMSGLEKLTGPLPQPQTTPGRYAGAASQNLLAAGALAPGSGFAGLGGGLGGGVGSEAGGDIAQGMGLPKTAGNIAGGIAGGLAGGIAGGYLPGNPQRAAYTGPNPDLKVAAEKGQELGMTLTPGQRSGRLSQQSFEASAESHASTAGPFKAIRTQNQEAGQRAVSEAIGQKADRITSSVLAQADERLGRIFDAVKAKGPAPVNKAAQDASLKQFDDAMAEFGALANKPVDSIKTVDRAINALLSERPALDELRDISTKLRTQAKPLLTSQGGDRSAGLALSGIRNAVEDRISAALPAAERAEYELARQQYRNLMTILKNPATVEEVSGKVNLPSLASALAREDRRGYVFGANQSPMYTAARFSQGFPNIVGDSGTATRQSLPDLIKMGGAGAGIGGLVGGPLGAWVGGGLGVTALPGLLNLGARGYLHGRLPPPGILAAPLANE